MKPIIEETIEQITGKPQHAKPPVSQTLKDQLDPAKAFKEALRQVTGFSDKPIPTEEEIMQKEEKDARNSKIEQAKILEGLGVKKQPEKPLQPQPPKKPVLGELAPMSSKRKRGDLYGAHRKTTHIETRSGPTQ